jgi:hypothetical protein
MFRDMDRQRFGSHNQANATAPTTHPMPRFESCALNFDWVFLFASFFILPF